MYTAISEVCRRPDLRDGFQSHRPYILFKHHHVVTLYFYWIHNHTQIPLLTYDHDDSPIPSTRPLGELPKAVSGLNPSATC